MLIRRRPYAAGRLLAAILLTAFVGVQGSSAASKDYTDSRAPRPIDLIQVSEATATGLKLRWLEPRPRSDVAGYGVYLNGLPKGTTVEPKYELTSLTCGVGYLVGVDVFDKAGNRSPKALATISTSACADRTPPSAPGGLQRVTATDSSVVISWAPSNDDIGVVEYGLYVGGLRVGTTGEPAATISSLECGKSYFIGIDAADAVGNRSPQTSLSFSTAPCLDRTAPTTPKNLVVTGATGTTVNVSWSPSIDNAGVTGYGLYVAGTRVSTTSTAAAAFAGLTCGRAYDVGVDATDAAGNRSSVATLSVATKPCAAPSATIRQTVVAGSTLSGTVNWRAVYDANGDGVEDDPGSVRFLVDGKAVLTEIDPPFGDTSGFWSSKSIADGTHAFEVLALNAAGATIASNVVSAKVSNTGTGAKTTPTIRQTIAAGSTLSGTVNWRAVYDANGDGVEDDPGSVRFVVDGKVVLTEVDPPFGDTSGFWSTNSMTVGQHAFEVEAVNPTGSVVASNEVSGNVLSAGSTADTSAPTLPGNLRVLSAGATSITIGWSASADDRGVVGYDLYRAGSRVGTTAVTTATFDGLTCGLAQVLGVDAYDAAGNRSQRVDLSVSTAACADNKAPTAPVNVVMSNRTTTSIALTWSASTDDVGVVGYGLYRGGSLTATTIGTTAIFNGLTCGTNYTLGVDGYDAAGNRSPQSTVMIATSACSDTSAPSTPGNLQATNLTQTSLSLAWSPSTDNVAVTSYRVYRNGAVAQSTTALNSSLGGLACGTTYQLGVEAVDAAGNVSGRATTSVTTTACAAAPTGTLFVSNGGSDANPCSQSAPCGTIARALKVAAAGQTILLAAGNYQGETLTGDKSGGSPVVISPASGATATIVGSRMTLQNLHNVTLKGLRFSTADSYRDLLFDACNSDVTVDGITARKFTMIEGNDHVTIRNSSFGGYGTPGDTSDNAIGTAGATGPTRSCGGGTAGPSSNIVIENSSFHDVFWGVPQSQWAGAHPDCLEVNGYVDGLTIRNNDFYHCQDSFFALYPDQGDVLNVTFTGNMLHDGGTDSWFAIQHVCDTSGPYRGGNVTFSNNTFDTNPNALDPYPSLRAACIARSGYASARVIGNTFVEGPPSSSCTVSRSTPYDTVWSGNTFTKGSPCGT